MSVNPANETANETPISLAKAARTLPGGPVHISTLYRWQNKGVGGVRLRTFKRGGGRYTYPSWLEEFFAALTAVADGAPAPSRSPRQREREISTAERACEQAGI